MNGIIIHGKVILNRVRDSWDFSEPTTFLYAVDREYRLYLENRELGLSASGRNWKELFRNLDRAIQRQWNGYVHVGDRYLSDEAYEMKQMLMDRIVPRGDVNGI